MNASLTEVGFHQTFDSNGSVMLLIDPVGAKIVAANTAALTYYGYPQEKLLGSSINEINTMDWEATALARKEAISPERNRFTFKHRLSSGELRDVEAFFSPVEVDNRPLLFSVVHDVTRLKQTQEDLIVTEAVYRAVFQTSLDAIALTRASDGLFVDVNSTFLEALGFERDEVIGRTSHELNIWPEPEDRNILLGPSASPLSMRSTEIQLRCRDGSTLWAMASVSDIEIDSARHLFCVLKNITEAKEAEQKIRLLSLYDPVTRLPNRGHLLEHLAKSGEGGDADTQQRAVIVIHLDNFRSLNECLGQRLGDLLLMEIARRIGTCIRDRDMVSRISSTEFAAVLENLGPQPTGAAENAQGTAEKMLAAVQVPFPIGDAEYHVQSSFGITVFSRDSSDPESLLQRATIASSHARAGEGEEIRFFSPTLQASINARAQLREDLRRGIATDQLMLFYQPQVKVNTLIGAEALVRWNHPKRGLIAPGEFIPLAEETGLIVPLGKWVLRKAMEQSAAWAGAQGSQNITISINITAHQFREPNFVEEVMEELERTGADPRKIKLELTESLLVSNFQDLVAKLERLKALGLSFSIDDFGTGYSCLAYMKHLPIDELKIDRCFVKDIAVDLPSAAIAQTVLSLARALHLRVIAEGVETLEQCRFLADMGVDTYQGYLFGRPLPVADFERTWLHRAATRA